MNTTSSNNSDGTAPELSIIVPTYGEAENLPHLIQAIGEVIAEKKILCELLILDDASDDGTPEVVAALDKPWVRLITRSGERGLSLAVLEGLREARADRRGQGTSRGGRRGRGAAR